MSPLLGTSAPLWFLVLSLAGGCSSGDETPTEGGGAGGTFGGAAGGAGAAALAGTGGAGAAPSGGSGSGATGAAGSGGATVAGTGGNAGGAGGGTTGGQGGGGGASGGGGGTTSAVFDRYDLLTSSYIDAPQPTSGSFGPQLTRDVAFDSQGNIVVVGGTSTATFPTTTGAYDEAFSGSGTQSLGTYGDMDAFVAKFDRSGNMMWGTFLGGPSYDRAYAVEVGPNDDVFVAGRAGDGFPATAGALQESFAGDSDVNAGYGPQDGFIARISADGGTLAWATYFGATGRGFIRDMDVDSSGNVHVALSDVGGAFPFSPGADGPRTTLAGGRDAYYGKVSSDGATLLFGTYLGGTDGGVDDGTNPSVRVTPGGDVYFVTFTTSTNVDCITPGAYQETNAGSADLLIARFSATNSLVYCTYFGGSGFEGMETHGLAVDSEGNAYVAGGTGSTDLPTTADAAQTSKIHDNGDGFVAQLSADGTALLASTYVGIPGLTATVQGMALEGLALAPNGDVVAGGSDRPNDTSTRHAITARISGDLRNFVEVTTFGGSGMDELRAVAIAPSGDVAFGGHTTSSDWPTANAFDGTYSSAPHTAATFMVMRPVLQ